MYGGINKVAVCCNVMYTNISVNQEQRFIVTWKENYSNFWVKTYIVLDWNAKST